MPEQSAIPKQTQNAPVASSVLPVTETLKQDLNLESLLTLPVQRKLTVGTADDPLEDEADAMADRVMRMPASSFIRRKCAHCEDEETKMQRKETNNSETVSDASTDKDICEKNDDSLLLQPKLTVGAPDDVHEQEADRIADQIMRMPEGKSLSFVSALPTPQTDAHLRNKQESYGELLQRKCTNNEEEDIHRKPQSFLQKQSEESVAVSPAIANNIHSSKGKGVALDTNMHSFMANRFGRNFSEVRIHTGSEPAQMNTELKAKAFTVGNDIYFNENQYKPQTTEGKHLLAHELTHVVQQGIQIRKFPYQTVPTTTSDADLNQLRGQNYWELRTNEAFEMRHSLADEERDAVFAAFWARNPPTHITQQITFLIPIAARTAPVTGTATQASAVPLLCEVTLDPPATSTAKPAVTFRIVMRSQGAAPIGPPHAPATFTPTISSFNAQDFPTSSHDYFQIHPEERRDLFNWIETLSPATFDQIITTSSATTGPHASTHHSAYRVSGSRTGGHVTNLNIQLLTQSDIGNAITVPADYHTRQSVDFLIEQLQSRTSTANRLGTITYPTPFPADEQFAVKNAIVANFDTGHSRNTEIDAVISLASGGRSVLYTLIFGSHNNVHVIRVGERGTGTGRMDLNRIDVRRIYGFPGISATDQQLRSWWATRYPQGGALPAPSPATPGTAPTASTNDVLINQMNQLITTGIANPTWFSQNYGIDVLGASALATRLQTIHTIAPTLITDTQDFNAQYLRDIELGLETLSPSVLGTLRGIKVGRKNTPVHPSTTSTVYGETFSQTTGSHIEITVVYYGTLHNTDDSLFLGNTLENARASSQQSVLHELGHAVVFRNNAIISAFNARFGGSHLPGHLHPTWYAATSSSEYFPEAFSLFQADPHFLCGYSPQMYAWFLELSRTGTPLAASASLPTPTCP